ncbi:MAG: hypothetical protein IPJ17_17850 [Holophagales bacterium]|nr:MAG: hypothetical protein IPJ17_17850 [Holophagales bacterium]
MAGKAWEFFVHRSVGGLAPEKSRTRPEVDLDTPTFRPLRVYTQDPSVPRLDGAITTLAVRYEPLDPGPAGAYFVVREDPEKPGEVVVPVDLERPDVLMRDGFDPSTTDRRFACQMTYAVAMETYGRFQRALGRDPGFAWSSRDDHRLVIRPHAFQGANAYYDRRQGAVLFGWDEAREFAQGLSQPGGHVYLCLSRDVVAHEVTHALLDGLRPNFLRPTHPDVPALHEAIADLVAIFLHFAQTDVVESAIDRKQGSLDDDQLAAIGRQFGYALGTGRSPLRTAVYAGRLENEPIPDDYLYDPTKEVHVLGSVFVSAVFDAFRRIFERQTRKLRRVLAPYQGRLSSEAVELLAEQASRLAGELLNVLIRAVDYCPSHHCTFGEYLRAMITADFEIYPQDPWAYREALVTAFRRYGICVPEVPDLSERALLWKRPTPAITVPELRFDRLNLDCDGGFLRWRPGDPVQREAAGALGRAICNSAAGRPLGLMEPKGATGEIGIYSLRTLRRVAPDDEVSFDLVAEVVQKRRVREGYFLGGCTLVIDSQGKITYAVYKDVDSRHRLRDQRRWLRTQPEEIAAAAWDEHSAASTGLLQHFHAQRNGMTEPG